MADLLVTKHLDPTAWRPALALRRRVGSVELARATDVFELVPLDGDGDQPAFAAVCQRGDAAELLALVVRDDRRGEGLGGRLLDGVADALRAGGSHRMWATDDGFAGSRWLVDRGFERISTGRLELLL